MSEEQEPKRRESLFIRTNNEIGTIFVPRPDGWISGWARHEWLKKHFGRKCDIASPALWVKLYGRHPIMRLIEEDGVFREERVDGEEAV